jgi:hypothetical protein
VFHELTVNGVHLIPLRDGRALAESRSSPGTWYEVSWSSCECQGFAYSRKRTCRHVAALVEYLGLNDVERKPTVEDRVLAEVGSFDEWRERSRERRAS